ncbi:MAG: S46 family peptidase [Bacteroidia bacterium]|nr:S46 family peptidase [Bacteroidia bacterium]
MSNLFHRLRALLATLAIAALLGGCGAGTQTLSDYDTARKAELETIKAGRFDGGRMWTFEYPPLDYFGQTYGFRPDNAWMEDARLSSLRMSTGCSASFVSADGLVMTNHHCSRTALVAIQKDGEILLDSGFFAPTLADERKVPNVYFDQLLEIRDVTKDIHAVMDAASTDKDRVAARDAKIKEIQAAAEEETKLRAQVVTLYNGGKYSLYLYRRFNDCRIVFAPELQTAHYGGEHDNFTYPRYSLDVTFFRIYDEEGKPYKPENWFEWSKSGAREDELVFVIGNPGSTNRLSTTEQLEYFRDVQYPAIFELINNRMDVLLNYSEMNPDKRQELRTDILSMSNSQKAYAGRLSGLRDDVLMQRRRDFDKQFKSAVMSRPELKAKYGHVWDEIAETRRKLRSISGDLYGLRMNGIGVADHLAKAGQLVRLATELRKKEDERQDPYKGQTLELTRRAMGKPVSADPALERLTLERQLHVMMKQLGAEDPVVVAALRGRDAKSAAQSMVSGSMLSDSVRLAALIAGAPESIMTSEDPFIVIARMAMPRLEKAIEINNGVSAADQVNRTLLGRALFDVYGTEIPPDATFTLRIADGVVKGYDYNGTKAPAYTTFYGMYDRYKSFPGRHDWELPERWKTPPATMNLATPLNFASTNDIIGGNSGSPMINKNQEVVGLIFDGNIESLPGDFIFAEDRGNRTVSVHSAGIMEAVRHIFKAERVARELELGRIP